MIQNVALYRPGRAKTELKKQLEKNTIYKFKSVFHRRGRGKWHFIVKRVGPKVRADVFLSSIFSLVL